MFVSSRGRASWVLFCALLCALLLQQVQSSTAQPVNLITNEGFGNGLNSWATGSNCWSSSSTLAYNSTHSAKTTSTSNFCSLSQTVTTKDSTNYAISFAINVVNATLPGVSILVQFDGNTVYSANGSQFVGTYGGAMDSNGWVVLSFVAPATGTSAALTFKSKNAAGTYIDTVLVYSAITLTATAPVTSILPTVGARPLLITVALASNSPILVQGDTATVVVTCGSGQVRCGSASQPAPSEFNCTTAASARSCSYTFNAATASMLPTDGAASFNIMYAPRGKRNTMDTCSYVVKGTGTGSASAPSAMQIYLGPASQLSVALTNNVGVITSVTEVLFTVTSEWPATSQLKISPSCVGGATSVGQFLDSNKNALNGYLPTMAVNTAAATFYFRATTQAVASLASQTVLLCTFALVGTETARFIPPPPMRLVVGPATPSGAAVKLVQFTQSGRGLPSSPLALQAGSRTDSIVLTPTRAVTAGQTVTVNLRCQQSVQRATAVFTSTTTSATIIYRAPLHCGITDSCVYEVTASSPSELARFATPVWDNTRFAATATQMWNKARDTNMADEVMLGMAGW